MKLLPLSLILLSTLITFTSSKKEKCEVVTQEDCENMTSEYEKYRACMERRTKRSTDCSGDSCDDCDCNTCSYNSCNTCGSCCAQCCQSQTCTTSNCCHQTCRAECRSNSCRSSCKKRCTERAGFLVQTSEGQSQVSHKSDSKHNITTVIHLNNVINNTNLINLPINVNNTVFNNITNEGGQTGGYYVGGGGGHIQQQSKEGCCTTVGPRQCIPQTEYPFTRCFHLRQKTCGPMCTAPIVHYQKHEVCDSEQQQPCHQQIVYVPQPQPKCAYHSTWPYVTCGNSQVSCDGCYDHYIKREDLTKCSNYCYDDGYGAGPYYRQGPYYRPGYAHVPSCWQTGTCGMEGYGGPELGFPFEYPPQTYPYVIEDCEGENCTLPPIQWNVEGKRMVDITDEKGKNVQWIPPEKLIKIVATEDGGRHGRYAEIRIKKHKKSTTTYASTTERVTAETVPPEVTAF